MSALRLGNTRTAAAQFAGIHYSTLWEWMQAYPEFREAVEKAEADCEVAMVGRVKAAAVNGDWKAAAWWLSRRRMPEWGENSTVTVESAPMEVKHTVALSEGNAVLAIGQLAAALDIMVGVGAVALPEGGRGEPRAVGPNGNAEVDEVHPAKPHNGRSAV